MKCGCILLLEGVVAWVSELDLHFGLGSCSGQWCVFLAKSSCSHNVSFNQKQGLCGGGGLTNTPSHFILMKLD